MMTSKARIWDIIVPALFLLACVAPATAVSRRTLRDASASAVEIQAADTVMHLVGGGADAAFDLSFLVYEGQILAMNPNHASWVSNISTGQAYAIMSVNPVGTYRNNDNLISASGTLTAGGVSFLDVDSIPFSLYGQSDGGVGLFSAVLVDDTEETYTTQVAFVMITPPDVPTLEVTVPIATLPKIVPAAAAAIPIEIDLTHVKIDTMAVAASSLSLGSPSYVGCYLDQVVTAKEAAGAALDGDAWTQSMWTDRALPYVQLTKVNSIQACAAIASAHDSLFFGMEAGSECWYGDRSTSFKTATRFGNVPHTPCNVVCPGLKAGDEICGGRFGAISLYTMTPQTTLPNTAFRAKSDPRH